MCPNVKSNLKRKTQRTSVNRQCLKYVLHGKSALFSANIKHQISSSSSECEDFLTIILALCMFYEPNKLFACPLLCCFTGESSPSGSGDASGLHGDTMLPSLSLSSSAEKLEENRALQKNNTLVLNYIHEK